MRLARSIIAPTLLVGLFVSLLSPIDRASVALSASSLPAAGTRHAVAHSLAYNTAAGPRMTRLSSPDTGCGLIYNCTFANNGDGWSHPTGSLYSDIAVSRQGGTGSDWTTNLLTDHNNERTGYYHLEFDYNSPCVGNVGLGHNGSAWSGLSLRQSTGGSWVHVSQDVRDNPTVQYYNSFFLEYCSDQNRVGPPYPQLRHPVVTWIPPSGTPEFWDSMGRGSPSGHSCACMNQYVKPVNAATGDFWHTFNDLRIPGRGMPLTFTHTYNSLLANQDGPLGFGWTNNENMFLTTSVTGAITVTEEGGSAVSFTAAGNVYQAPTRVLAGLVRNGDGTLTFTRYKERIAYTFASPAVGTPGVLLKETDRNGYTTTFTYSNGHLSSVTDAAGRSLTFTYTGSHIAGITDPIGRTVTFGYDGAGNLTSVVDVGGHVTQFAYGTGTHLMTSMTDPNGGTTSNLYDSNGRAISQTDPLSRTTTFVYTDNGDTTQTTTVTDPRGTVTKEHYQYNELYSMTKASGTPQQATWTYAYDPTTLGITSKTDPNGHTTTMTYDSSGNLLTSIDPLLRTTSYAYDGLNDTTAITDSLGNVTSMTYDSNGNLLSTSRTLAHSPVGAMTAGGPMTLAPRPHMVLAAIARSNGDSIGGSRVPYGRDSRGTRSGQPGASRLFTARPQGTAPYAVSLPGARATGGGWRIAVLHSSADNGHQYEVVGAPLRAGAVPVHAAAAHQRVQVTYAPPSPRRRTPSRCTPAPMIPVGEFIVAPKVVTQGTDGRALHVTVHGIGRYMPSGRHGLPGQARIHLAWDAITVHGRWHMGRDLGLISRQKYGTNTWTATVPHYLLTHADIHRISVFIVFPNGRTTDSESGGRLIVGRRAGRGYLLVQGGHICPPIYINLILPGQD